MIILITFTDEKIGQEVRTFSPSVGKIEQGELIRVTDLTEQSRYLEILREYLFDYPEEVPSASKNLTFMYLDPESHYPEAVLTFALLTRFDVDEETGKEERYFILNLPRLIKYSAKHSWDYYWQIMFDQVIMQWLNDNDQGYAIACLIWQGDSEDARYLPMFQEKMPPERIRVHEFTTYIFLYQE